jgi:hypothetical protein
MVLPVTIVMHEDEIPESRANRLCAANQFSSFDRFLSMTGMTVKGLASGEVTCISRLAKWSGADPSLLARNAIVTQRSDATWRIGQAVFGNQFRRGARFRYCPACILEDMEEGHGRTISRPYVRSSWTCRAVNNCTIHKTAIVEIERPKTQGTDFCLFIAQNLDVIRKQASKEATTQTVDLDAYIEKRIRGDLTEPNLDRWETHVVIELCSYLGEFLTNTPSRTALLGPQWRYIEPRVLGLHVAQKGYDAIRPVIERVIDLERPDGSTKFLFGNLGRWLRSNAKRTAYAEVVELFQDIAERNLPFASGEKCFVPVRQRYIHTVQSAGTEYKLGHERIISLLREAGLLEDVPPTAARGSIYFDAERAHPILVAACQTVTSREARSELGVTEEFMRAILEAGLLPRVENREHSRIYTRIRRDDLSSLKSRIFGNVTCGDINGLVNIASASRRAGLDNPSVLTMLMDGKLSKVRMAEGDNLKLSSLRFCVEEVRAHVCRTSVSRLAGAGSLTKREASAFLKVKPTTIPYLVENGFLETTVIANPVNRQKQRVVFVSSLEAFAKEYVAVSEVAKQNNTHPLVVLNAAERAGIRTIYDKSGNVSRFFRRSDVGDLALRIRYHHRN